MGLPTLGRLLAVDWGEIRLGIAISDETQLIATPLDTLTRRRGKRFPMPAFLGHVTRHKPTGILVGLPLAPDGTEGDAARAARSLAAEIGGRTYLPVEMWDERMSTARALSAIKEQGGSPSERRKQVDAVAAAVLLQHYLDARRSVP
ncbi:MAG: Holliday junction resolvase RuvX [Gemmatimonadetes bacterium]|nr:Holliday junction resolvase RuvX [Gemmatimonadota bacterium]